MKEEKMVKLKEKVMRETGAIKKYHLSSTLHKLVHKPKKHLSFSLDKEHHRSLNRLVLTKLKKFEIHNKSAENSFLGGISKKDKSTKVISILKIKKERNL